MLKADYHGAVLVITQAKCTSLIGQGGLVLMETRHTFKVITTENIVKSKIIQWCLVLMFLYELWYL